MIKWMKADETAKYLKVSKSTIYKLARQKEIPAAKIARSWRFSRIHIDHWLLENMEGRPSSLKKSLSDKDDNQLSLF
ncbi:helix-turn-helix domain-containing protein [bacterium]|nr:helix-turn-helix domain-containing protein [bacterium]